ncbi:hypothetical protein [Parasitella parasitica]|uniref:Phosphodiesterase n=1 Tax=Parasitella parasitica TaxID=35722 RepID=A0A0B7NID4_9FUNG|nr:hypothetical protein [Parasitella parasitica]
MKRLNPNNCSVVVFYDGKETFTPTLDLLQSVFSNVIVQSRKSDIIAELKEQRRNESTSTLLLIDAESCDMKLSDECPDLLIQIVHFLRQGLLSNVVPIVCSYQDSPAFMVKCLHEGAADFVLKPLSKDVIKTLFLNATRYRIDKAEKAMETGSQISTACTNEANSECGEIWAKFKGRLKGVFRQEQWLSKLVADYYTPKPSVRRSSMTSMLNDRKKYLEAQICSWEFLPLDLDNKDLIQVVYMILSQVLSTFNELVALRVPSGDLYHFIFDICNSYHSTNPYHNFRHAVDVLQANYYFLCRLGVLEPMDPSVTFPENQSVIKSLFHPLDIFALLMASIGHDVGHPGVNNSFMITTSAPLAILYNDKSVLESFHAMSFFHLLREHCFSQLTDLRSNPEYATFRKIVVNSILATDMSMHDEYVAKIQDQAQRLKRNEIDFEDKAVCEKEKILICGALIKCADISNCARPFESARRWAQILAEEFFEQGDLEKELGMSVLPINERGKIPLEDFQLTFKRFVALKLFESVSSVTPCMQFTVDQIYENIGIWEDMKKNGRLQRKQQQIEQSNISPTEKNVVTPNNIPPQPSPEGKSSTSERPRSGI